MGLRPLIRRGRAVFRRVKFDQDETASSSANTDIARTTVESEKNKDREQQTAPVEPDAPIANNGAELPGVPYDELQTGVKDIEALAKTWSKGALIAVFIKYVNLWMPSCYIKSANTIPW